MVEIRFAIIDFPDPGGPSMRRLCPPAAATSTARRTACWPFTSAKSIPSPGGNEVTVEKRRTTGLRTWRPSRKAQAASIDWMA